MRAKRLYLGFLAATVVLSASVMAGPAAASGKNQVPPQLAGQWAIPWSGGTEYLTLADSHFMFFFDQPSRHAVARGAVSVSGNTITFYSSNQCTGTGTYYWSRSDGGLTFVQVPGSFDPCPRAAILTSGTWTRR